MITLKIGSPKDLDGADLVRLIARAQDREMKLKRIPQAVERPEKTKTSLSNKLAGWFLLGVGLYIFIHVIVALARR